MTKRVVHVNYNPNVVIYDSNKEFFDILTINEAEELVHSLIAKINELKEREAANEL